MADVGRKCLALVEMAAARIRIPVDAFVRLCLEPDAANTLEERGIGGDLVCHCEVRYPDRETAEEIADMLNREARGMLRRALPARGGGWCVCHIGPFHGPEHAAEEAAIIRGRTRVRMVTRRINLEDRPAGWYVVPAGMRFPG